MHEANSSPPTQKSIPNTCVQTVTEIKVSKMHILGCQRLRIYKRKKVQWLPLCLKIQQKLSWFLNFSILQAITNINTLVE